jgi:LPS-assembly protein
VDQELPWGAKAKLDLVIVSDQDYLTEFRNGQSGFYATKDYFLYGFGRDIDPYDETIRSNRLNINRTWSRYVLNGDLLWNDNVTNRRWEETDDTLQQLPVIQFNAAKQQALDSPVFWDLDSEYTNFYREDGQRGHRTDIYPRAYLPLRWKNYLSLEPSAGWRQTAWVMDRRDDDTIDRTTHRQIYDARLDLSTRFSKVMGSPVAALDRIRHSVKPRVIYNYIPDQDQSDLPDFDTDIDRIDEANQVTYSLTNLFTARTARKNRTAALAGTEAFTSEDEMLRDIRPRGRSAATGSAKTYPSQPEQSTPQIYDYNRICRFYLEQTYDIAAARDDDPEPFSDIFGELDLYFGRYFSIDSDASFDTYDSRFSAHNLAASIKDHRGDRLWITHSYQKDEFESVRGTLLVKLTNRLTARGEYERNLFAKKDLLKGAGFLYTAQCWSVDFFFAREDVDNRFTFAINLMGVGGFGK